MSNANSPGEEKSDRPNDLLMWNVSTLRLLNNTVSKLFKFHFHSTMSELPLEFKILQTVLVSLTLLRTDRLYSVTPGTLRLKLERNSQLSCRTFTIHLHLNSRISAPSLCQPVIPSLLQEPGCTQADYTVDYIQLFGPTTYSIWLRFSIRLLCLRKIKLI